MIIDTHVHYDDEAFDVDREELIGSLQENNIGLVLDIGSTKESLPKIRSLLLGEIREDMKNPKVLAVGEIGLDYYWNKEEQELQKAAFRKQINLALECGKPVVIHSREAAADTLEILREMYGKGSLWEALHGSAAPGASSGPTERKGVMHCYSYSAEQARIYTRELGFYLGIGGVVTFKNAKKIKEVVADTPLEYIILETAKLFAVSAVCGAGDR